MNEQERVEGIATNVCKAIRKTAGADCGVGSPANCSFCSAGGNIQGIVAGALSEWGDTRAREAVEECAKVAENDGWRDKLHTCEHGNSPEAAYGYHACGSCIVKAIRTLLPTPSPTQDSPVTPVSSSVAGQPVEPAVGHDGIEMPSVVKGCGNCGKSMVDLPYLRCREGYSTVVVAGVDGRGFCDSWQPTPPKVAGGGKEGV